VGDWEVVEQGSGATEFVGYDQLEADMKLLRYRKTERKRKNLYHLVFDRTPFYPEGGGQVGDKGFIESDGKKLPILNTFKENNLVVHLTNTPPEGFSGMVKGVVKAETRSGTTKNHTATHLLHHALREVLGKHVEQKGSLVEKDYLRFDFSHFSKVSDEELRKVEEFTNSLIRADINLQEYRGIPIKEAKEMGAIMLFGEKYGDEVRVIKFGDSIELCGGTHAGGTGELGFFKIITETSVAAGIRRIEAISGRAAESYIYESVDTLSVLRSMLKATGPVAQSVQALLDNQQALITEMEAVQRERAADIKQTLIQGMEEVNGIKFIGTTVSLGSSQIKELAYQLRKEISPLFLVLGTIQKDKAMVTVALSDDLVKSNRFNSGTIVKELSSLIKGGGGGQAFFATAGGKSPEGLPSAIQRAKEILRKG
jgi:alanyl-tRNA synthetase